MVQAGEERRQITGRDVALAVFAFFGSVTAVNGVLITKAISTNSGLVANEPYRKGLKYNDRIAADERQAELGWQSKFEITPGNAALSVLLTGRGSAPVVGQSLALTVGRPASNRDDIAVKLIEREPGRYEAVLPHALKGAYVADLEVSDASSGSANPIYRARRRIWAEPSQ